MNMSLREFQVSYGLERESLMVSNPKILIWWRHLLLSPQSVSVKLRSLSTMAEMTSSWDSKLNRSKCLQVLFKVSRIKSKMHKAKQSKAFLGDFLTTLLQFFRIKQRSSSLTMERAQM